MSAAGPPQGARPPGGTERIAVRGEPAGAEPRVARLRMPFGALELVSDGRALTRVAYLPKDTVAVAPSDDLLARAARELDHYLEDPDFRFTVPLAPRGTDFQQRVWRALRDIPAGAPSTYGNVARTVESAPRAVGQACGANPIALLIPCHRVIGTQGNLGGFMHAQDGDPVAIKRWLLAHEGVRFGA